MYLPDLDQKLHKMGPSDLEGLKQLDSQIHSILQSFGSAEAALEKAIFIIAGDSGMSQIHAANNDPTIDLISLFGDFNVLKPNEEVTDRTQIVLAVNETMAYIYSLQKEKLSSIANLLNSEKRIDIIAWKENDWIYVLQGGTNKKLKFRQNGKFMDVYKQRWEVEGDTEVLDLQINKDKRSIAYDKYPDGLQRLSSALHSHAGDFLVVTSKSGYELADNSSPTHTGGGGHGSLDKEVSLVPLIISGTDQKPQHLRIVDMKAYILKLLSD